MDKFEKVLVLGGSGFLGKSLRKFRPNWIYAGSHDCDLTDKNQCYDFFHEINPDAIINLAARVGGIKDNVNNQPDFYYVNSMIGLNVIHEAHKAKIPRVLSALSTCCYPDIAEHYPMTEDDFMKGEPTPTNYGYGYAKRGLHIQSRFYSQFYNVNYTTFSLSNVYGPENDFYANTSHFVSSLIKKFYYAKDGDTLEFWGTGNALRQHLYVDDVSKVIIKLLDLHNSDIPIALTPDENLSIREIVELCKKTTGKNIKIVFNNELTGQFRKDVSNKKLLELIGDYDFTSMKSGLKLTYDWYARSVS